MKYTSPRNHQDKHFEQDSWWSLKKCDLERHQGLLLIWPSNLVSDIKWPSFKLDLEIIKKNNVSNIFDDYLKNVTSGV